MLSHGLYPYRTSISWQGVRTICPLLIAERRKVSLLLNGNLSTRFQATRSNQGGS